MSEHRRSLTGALPYLLLGPPYIFLAKEAASKLNRNGLTYASGYTNHVREHISPFVEKASTIMEVGAGEALWSLREAGVYEHVGSSADVTFLDPAPFSAVSKEEAIKHFNRTPSFITRAISSDLSTPPPDLIISVFTLCSVSDLASSVRSIYDLLPPGSTYAFVEHVAAPKSTPYRTMQKVLTPLQAKLADNCHLDRETPRMIEEVFGNVEGHVVREEGMWPVAEVFYGSAVKR
ncbi:hypothetical protein TrCOL_g12686 [Triparma columacea]|uniref:Methyltransferase type 11 domain-containing protein n=1 Tax=Triparma columacea TaxID=722753 RepID=A0A9W7GJ64_9STRA|nr:hypothetical protein TrCOL_g12686 [Triparma columacea]